MAFSPFAHVFFAGIFWRPARCAHAPAVPQIALILLKRCPTASPRKHGIANGRGNNEGPAENEKRSRAAARSRHGAQTTAAEKLRRERPTRRHLNICFNWFVLPQFCAARHHQGTGVGANGGESQCNFASPKSNDLRCLVRAARFMTLVVRNISRRGPRAITRSRTRPSFPRSFFFVWFLYTSSANA